MAIYCPEGLGVTARRYHTEDRTLSGKALQRIYLKSSLLCFSSEFIVVLSTPPKFLVQQGEVIALECWFV